MAPAAPVMTEAILQKRNASDDSIYDRCYRIRNNTNQVHICNAFRCFWNYFVVNQGKARKRFLGYLIFVDIRGPMMT